LYESRWVQRDASAGLRGRAEEWRNPRRRRVHAACSWGARFGAARGRKRHLCARLQDREREDPRSLDQLHRHVAHGTGRIAFG